MSAYLTREQVLLLNEKHGYFQYADAQGDVSRAFAQDAVAMHEQMRQAAPRLLAALQKLWVSANTVAYCYENRPENFAVALKEMEEAADEAREVLAQAEGHGATR